MPTCVLQRCAAALDTRARIPLTGVVGGDWQLRMVLEGRQFSAWGVMAAGEDAFWFLQSMVAMDWEGLWEYHHEGSGNGARALEDGAGVPMMYTFRLEVFAALRGESSQAESASGGRQRLLRSEGMGAPFGLSM